MEFRIMRGLIRPASIVLYLLFQATFLYGAQNMPASHEIPPVKCDKHFLSIGGNYTYVKLTPSGLSSFTGNLGGVEFSYEYRPMNCVYEAVTFLWREGSTSSSGSLSRDIFDIDTQVRLGYTAKTRSKGVIIPFTGFGWRYIGQELTGGATPLDLNYNEVYIPVGLLLQYQATCAFSIGLNGIWMPQVFPTVNFIPLDNARWVTERTLTNFLVEVPLLFLFSTQGWNGTVEIRPFFEYWRDGKTLAASSLGVPLGLPANKYYFTGVQVNLGARF